MLISSKSHNFHAGVEVRTEFKLGLNPLEWGKIGKSASTGYKHERSRTNSSQTVWDPAQEALAQLEGAQALQQAINQADIVETNSAATVKNILLQTAELAIEEEILRQEFNRLSAAHNDLVNQYENLLNLRAQANCRSGGQQFGKPRLPHSARPGDD